jgi:hypothetical protein
MKSILFFLFFQLIAFAENQTFVDTQTHLEWEDTAHVEADEKILKMSKSYCSTLELEGHGDWRMPTRKELLSITDMVQHPTVARKFKFGTKGEYWTGEDYEEDDTLAWLVYMQYAHTYTDDKCETAQVRCVRDHR